MVAVSVLVSGLDAELVRLGCKDSTMAWYRGCWRRLRRYFAACGAGEFSLDLAMAWADEACGFFAKEQAGRGPGGCRGPVRGAPAGRWPQRLDRAVLWDTGRGVRRVRGHARRAGPL